MISDNTPVLTRPSARWAKAATAERRVLERKCGQLLRRRERVLAQLDPIGRTLDKIDERVALQAPMKEIERKYAADPETRQEALIQFYKTNRVSSFPACAWPLAASSAAVQLLVPLFSGQGQMIRDRLTRTVAIVRP